MAFRINLLNMKHSEEMKGFWKIGALIIAGVMAFLFAFFSEWNDDAIAYSFFIPRFNEDASFAPIKDIADIWNSQINHYFNSNGRFAVHFVVQLFCGLWGKSAFAICNAFVWMLLIYNLATLPKVLLKSRTEHFSARVSIVWLTAILCVIILGYLPFTPPFQINYVWVSMMIAVWIKWLFQGSRSTVISLILLALFSFITGQLHEGFSTPTGGAIIAYFVAKRCRFTSRQWVMAVCFGIGALSTILAPGNFYRMNVMEGGRESGILNIIAQVPNLFIFPAIYLVILYPLKKHDKFKLKDRCFRIFIITFILISLIFNLYLKSFDRGLIPFNLAFSILILLYASNHKIKAWKITILVAVALTIICYRGYETKMQNEKTKAIIKEYTSSETGRIYIPDNLFLFNLEETCLRRNTYTNLLRSRQGADKPFLVMYPESLKEVNLDKDTNMVIKIGNQSWLCVQSASRPSDFIVEKTILPGMINKKMGDRVLNFSSGSDIFIDSTANNRIVLYVNRRPYINAAVTHAPAQTVE